MSTIWFTADTHYDHGNIIKYCHRPFLGQLDKIELEKHGAWHDGTWKGDRSVDWRMSKEAIDLMNETLINNTNKLVAQNDILWHLGDFAFGKDIYKKCRYFRDRINCRNVNIIWGNHDHPEMVGNIFSTANHYHELKIGRDMFVLCHYALAIWNKSHRGSYQLYGHSHSEAEPKLDKLLPNRRSMDVGVDNAFKLLGAFSPFSIDDIYKFLGNKHGHHIGDHHINKNAPEES
jgi:calcineurin-like phosphoesterase family protein